MEFFERIDPKLRIGPNCRFMNISAFYEGFGVLYLSLEYTHLDFIYDKESFTKFINPKPSKEYIYKENELLALNNIDSKYKYDTIKYLDYFSSNTYKQIIETIEFNETIGLKGLKENYIDKGLPLMYVCDHYYTFEDYRKITNTILRFHSKGHMAILSGIDFDNETAIIIDKFHKFKGSVQLDNFEKSITSKYLSIKKFEIVRLGEIKKEKSEMEGFNKAFIKNFSQVLEPQIVIDGTKYYKNIKAIELFAEDFSDLIAGLYYQKGKYTPQFLSQLISLPLLQRDGFSNLLNYVSHIDDAGTYDELLVLCNESQRLWKLMDIYNDKCYLKSITILDDMDEYKRLLDKLVINDRKLYELMKIISI